MTVPELIEAIMHQLECQFYCDLPRRDFKRDQDYLVAAIGTYGYECLARGWEFDVGFIYQELCRLLSSFKRSGTEIVWMPSYLQNAIRRHIGEHAEELQRAARAAKPAGRLVNQVLDGVTVVAVVKEAKPIELAASVYRDVAKMRRVKAAGRKAVRVEGRRQGKLL